MGKCFFKYTYSKVELALIVIFVLIVVFVKLGVFGTLEQIPSESNDTASSGTESDQLLEELAKPLELTPEQYEESKQVYADEALISFRKILDDYLVGKPPLTDTEEGILEPDSYLVGQLEPYKAYFSSKFIVVYIQNALFGGVEAKILFKDKPDQLFHVWLYDADKWELRGFLPFNEFAPSKKLTDKDMEDMRIRLKYPLEDPEYGL